MSGPYRFNQDSTRSPLDRRPQNQFPSNQPVSYKTNVNRMKTKKWVEAKKNAYDGDDWGDYDEYDEYGVDEAPPPPSSSQPYDQRYEQPSRSFTDPSRQGPPQAARRNSFEAGDEHRSFSASIPPPQHGYTQQPHAPPIQTTEAMHSTHRQASMAESDTSDTPQHRRDFSPSALPPPLHTRMSPAPGSSTGSPATQFPPRKSSIGQADSPSATSPRDRAPSIPGKPLPFIRPADIYKRVEEERQRERASLDSGRPSLDSLTSRPREDVTSPQGLQERASTDSLGRNADASKLLQPLETVAERKSEYLPDFNVSTEGHQKAPQTSQQQSQAQPHGIIAFDSDFWSSGPPSQAPASDTPVVSPPDDQGFRSVVDQAFTRNDDTRSVPPTPVSKQSDSSVSRSNTGSTSGISPIMSRVPSSATSALKNRNQIGGDGSTPVIAEEASETNTPVSQPTSAAMLGGSHQIPRRPSPSHSRNVSSTSLPRSLATPSPGESPARSPAIAPQKALPEPESAQLSSSSPNDMEGGLGGPHSAYATREADIASAMKKSPDVAAPELSVAEKDSRDAFLESHNAQSPIADAVPRSRSESPSKGRVQELAGKFGDVSHSRRGSTQSNASRNSVQSWERSQDNSRPSSPAKADANKAVSPSKEFASERPTAGRETSFRPKLPGQWESYATTAATPSEQGDREKDFGASKEPPSGHKPPSPLEEVDLTPTTSKHPVSATEPSKSTSDPLQALKAAGAAVGEAITASVGGGPSSSEAPKSEEEKAKERSHGDVHPIRPLQFERTASSVSSIPPTPPEKDTPESEDLPPPPPLKEKSPGPYSPISKQQTLERPTIIPQLSTDASADDEESDRLRKEIVASLSPLRTSVTPTADTQQTSLQPTGPSIVNRESSILPSEYDSYWADGDGASPRPSHDTGRNVSEHHRSSTEQSSVATRTNEPQPSGSYKPSLLTRFSWEDQTPQLVSPEGQAQAGAVAKTSTSPQVEHQSISPISQTRSEEASEPLQGIPDTYFGPTHTAAVSKPAPINDSEITARSPTLPQDSTKPLASPTQTDIVQETSPTSGLHVVNSALNPEAVDMPPRLSAEASAASQPPKASHEVSAASNPPKGQDEAPKSESVPSSSTAQEPVAKSPDSDKPLGFRDIVTIKSASERIATYNKTREYWAKADHGLSDWMSSTLAANPELATQTYPQARPQLAGSSTSRHKPTGSLSLFGKHHGSSSQAQNTPYYEQYNSAASQVPTTPTSAAPTSHGHSTGVPGRSASHQMQAKGKDLLHSAGALGGKGMTGAKGLFAKGKSRFKSDKASRSESMPSSREASEEPELATMTPRMSMDTESPKDEKKRRRFSSPFHRSSRSRSRPNSIVLPSNAHFDFGTPRNTPPRETPPRETPPTEGSRPHSFHAPDSWDIMPDSQYPTSHTTPPRGGLQAPDRLGVLPSPAKSAFSLLPQDKDNDIPPVPPIPDGAEDMQRGRQSQDNASHRMLQSVIRHSTPPTIETSKLQDSPVFAKPSSVVESDTQAGVNKERKGMKKEAEGYEQGNECKPSVLMNEPNSSKPLPHQTGHINDEDDGPPQTDDNTLTPNPPPQNASQASGISPPTGPNGTDRGDISSVVSSLEPERWDDSDNDDKPPRLAQAYLKHEPRHTPGDVSPMFPPANLARGGPNDGPRTPTISRPRDGRPSYETELIGAGDVSPISSRTNMDEEATPTKTKEDAARTPTARQTSEITVEVQDAGQATAEKPASGEKALAPHLGKTSSTAPPPVDQRLSASPYQVVHAVQYVPSHSSFESWEHDSVAAPSQSDGSQMGDKHEDSDAPPVPQIPNVVQQEDKTDEAIEANKNPPNPAASKMPVEEDPPSSDSVQQATQQPPTSDTAKPGIHKRSQSLLSAISSMVSEDNTSVSPVSSIVRRSRPSSANRRQQALSAKTSPTTGQIVEETAPEKPKSISTAADDDFDLYADLNGIVKDVKDESGQPLRVATAQIPGHSNASRPSQTEVSKSAKIQESQEDESNRYSDERPMSFVYGPRDANGTPQEQINRPTAATDADAPPVPRVPSQLQGQSKMGSVDTAQVPTSHSQSVRQPNGADQQQERILESHLEEQQVSSPPSSQRQEITTPPHNNISSPPHNISPQPTPPQDLAQRPLLSDPRMQNGQLQDPRMQDPRMMQDPRNQDPRFAVDPRMRGMAPGQPFSLNAQMPRQVSGQDHRMQGQPVGPPPGPRNQYELQQQMIQRQYQPQLVQPAKQEGKSSRPKLSSVFKGFGGKSHSNTQQSNMQQPTSQPIGKANSSLAAPLEDPNRSASYQSSVGNLPTEQIATKKERRLSRPQSMGTESHISQDSTRVQAADSRLDLRYPASPAPFKGIPPPQPPPGAPVPPPQQSQPQRASTSGVPEAGKKKRFSALGNLFNRSGTTGHAVPTKAKMTKEEKKAQKAQRHTTAPPMQPPQAQQWPPRQQQFPPQYYGMQYGPPPIAARPFPGMQGVVPQTMSPQAMSPMSPQGMYPQGIPQSIPQGISQGMPPRGIPPQGMPPQIMHQPGMLQQYMQPLPQGYQQQQQQQMQRQRPEGSAYIDTRQIAQAHQAQRQFSSSSQQPSQSSRPATHTPNFSFDQKAQEQIRQAPPGGYYKPDAKHPDTGQASAPVQPAQQQQHGGTHEQPPNLRRVSSPASSHGSHAPSQTSQRRVSSPTVEPKYDTPQIPAAYNHVSGAYISPKDQPLPQIPPPNVQTAPGPSPAPYGRQGSDPQMQPISPQVSQQSQMVQGQRHPSDASTSSVVSPISNPSPGIPSTTPVANSRPQKPRMSSITEATHQERPWNLNLREGATEQEIVRARQQQYMAQQLAAQEQLHAERTGHSPSPRPSPHTQSPSPQALQNNDQAHQSPSVQSGGGFREVLPRSSPQPYPMNQPLHQSAPSPAPREEKRPSTPSHNPHPAQPAPLHPGQAVHPAAYPLPISPDSANIRSPVNPMADALPPPPPPKIPHSPMRPVIPESEHTSSHAQQQVDHHQPQPYQTPLPQNQPDYEQQPPDEPPPSYSGLGVPNEGMDKERFRPPPIMTDADIRGRQQEPRIRQASIGILQHPQPASMAASPQRSSADMGADILRRQLLEQEERERQERLTRAEIQRVESERERQERERARARARELERSVSGGGRVGSLRSVAGSGRGSGPGWERRGSTTRPVFELPAEEDDEPVMRATSFPGQEWVPQWTED